MPKNEIQRVETSQHGSLLERGAALIEQSGGNMTPDHLEKLLDVHLRNEANEARKAYVVAMAAFKEDPPEILKDKTVSFKQTSYRHATLYNVTNKINTALSLNGLTASWVTSQDNGSVKVTCKITHVLGHSEETSLSAPPDTSGSKNAIQAIASTVTYLERYTLFALTGLAGKDQDDDAAGAGNSPPTVRPPTDEEWTVIAEVCKAITAPPGKCVDRKKVAAICYEKEQSYPDMTLVDRVVAWFAKFDRPEIFIPIPKDEFDEHVENFNGEHGDEAAKEAEETAAAKFGTENDQPEQKVVRWRCLGCDREFPHRNKNHKCPHCFSDDIEDRNG